ELDGGWLSVGVAVEVEEVGLDPQRRPAVVRVDADRDRRALPVRGAGVDALRRQKLIRRGGQVRGREPESLSPPVSLDHDALDLERMSEDARRLAELAGGDEPGGLVVHARAIRWSA